MAPKTRNFARRIGAHKAAEGRHAADKIWNAMRMLRHFTAAEVVAVIDGSTNATVTYYARKLAIAGFVRVARGNGGRHEPHSYFLVRDTGPFAPSFVKRRTFVYDHNTDQEYALK